MVNFKGENLLMRVHSLDVEEDTGRYLHLDLLFAALNQYTEGIYIKGEAVQEKMTQKEKKRAKIDKPEYARMDNDKEEESIEEKEQAEPVTK